MAVGANPKNLGPLATCHLLIPHGNEEPSPWQVQIQVFEQPRVQPTPRSDGGFTFVFDTLSGREVRKQRRSGWPSAAAGTPNLFVFKLLASAVYPASPLLARLLPAALCFPTYCGGDNLA